MSSPELQAVLNQTVQSRGEDNQGGMMPLQAPQDALAYDAGMLFQVGSIAESIPAWSIYPAVRDRQLRRFYKSEPIIAGTVYSLSARISALNYTLTGEEERHDDIKAMFNAADFGNGVRDLISKTVTDLCTQDNGFFWELIGAGRADGELLGDVQGVNYLDPAQCYRTFDPEYPVMYLNPIKGTRHKLHRTRVLSKASMPQPNELARGIGYSGVSRVLLSVQLMSAIQNYRYEKSSGNFGKAIGYGTGMTQQTLQQLFNQVDNEAANEGFVHFRKIPFYVSPRKEVALDILDLASIPDGFSLVDEVNTYVYTVANGFGVDAREIWTATQSGATKGDAEVQNMKAKGKGLADLIVKIEDSINAILPEGVKFEFDFVDEDANAVQIEQRERTVAYLTNVKNAGGITDEQYQALLIYEGVLPEEVLMQSSEIAVDDFEDEEEENPLDTPFDTEEPTEDEDEDEQPSRAAMKSAGTFGRALRSAARAYLDFQVSQVGFASMMDSAIRRYYVEAWRVGLRRAGLSEGEQTTTERNELQKLVTNEQSYVLGLADYLGTIRNTDKQYQKAFRRLEMWQNRYTKVDDKAFSLAAKDEKSEWAVDVTKEHCIDCLRLSGRVYRNSIWDKYNIETQSQSLACRGFRCGCRKRKTQAPITRGRPPALSGMKSSDEYHALLNDAFNRNRLEAIGWYN